MSKRRQAAEAHADPPTNPANDPALGPAVRPGLTARLIARVTRPVRESWRSDAAIDDFALVHFASVAGDTFVAIALASTVFFKVPVGEASGKVAAYLALTMVPLALAGFPLVPLLDFAGPRRIIAFVAAAARCALAVLLVTGIDSKLLYPCAFGLLVFSKIHGITKNGLTMAYAGEMHQADLVQANARLARWGVAGACVAAPVAGLAAKLGGGGSAMVGAAAMYVVTSMLVLRLPHPHVPSRHGEVSKLGKLPELRVAAAGVVGLRIATGFLLFLLGFALRRHEAPLWWFGLLLGALTAGVYAGDFLAPKLPERLREEGIVLASLIAAGIGGVLAYTVFGIASLSLFCLLAGMSGEFGRLALQSLAQRYVPERAHGRVFVRYEVVFQLAWVAGALIPTLVDVPFQTGVFLMGVFYLMVAGVFVARPLVAERGDGRDGTVTPFDQEVPS